MKQFTLRRDVSGYSRGYQYVVVEAETLEEALENADWGDIQEEIVRDDRDKGDWE